jgi:hypothetical protein
MRVGVNGQSVTSTHGLAVLKHVNSASSPVKIVASSVFIDAPAGYHASGFGALSALAGWIVGRWKFEDNGPCRLARDNTTAKTSNSFTIGIVLKFSQKRVYGAYP